MATTKGGNPQTPTPPTAPVSTGGGGGDDNAHVIAPGSTEQGAGSKTRIGFVQDPGFEFHPASLVGSWFHRLENDRMVWQGVVVAEPQPGVYLIQIDTLDIGARNVQRLMPMSKLTNDEDGYDWRFYDSQSEARHAYAEWVATESQR